MILTPFHDLKLQGYLIFIRKTVPFFSVFVSKSETAFTIRILYAYPLHLGLQKGAGVIWPVKIGSSRAGEQSCISGNMTTHILGTVPWNREIVSVVTSIAKCTLHSLCCATRSNEKNKPETAQHVSPGKKNGQINFIIVVQ